MSFGGIKAHTIAKPWRKSYPLNRNAKELINKKFNSIQMDKNQSRERENVYELRYFRNVTFWPCSRAMEADRIPRSWFRWVNADSHSEIVLVTEEGSPAMVSDEPRARAAWESRRFLRLPKNCNKKHKGFRITDLWLNQFTLEHRIEQTVSLYLSNIYLKRIGNNSKMHFLF